MIFLEYLAHFDKEKNIKQTMCEHLNGVAEQSQFQESEIVNFGFIDGQKLKILAYIMGYFHDIGKYSSFFQDYITKGIDNKLKAHAHISACFVYNMLKKLMSGKEMEDNIMLFLVYLSIRQHHDCLHVNGKLFPRAGLEDIYENLNSIKENILKRSNDIVEDCKADKFISVKEFENFMNADILKKSNKELMFCPQWFMSGRNKDCRWYFFFIYIFSLLIDSDKLDTAGLKSSKTRTVSYTEVERYLKIKNKGKTISIYDKREAARKSMMEVINSMSDNDVKNIRFFILNGPTGIGKTLSSLECAIRLQERIKHIEGYIPRLITAIPFINIIEQNKGEYENVFGKDVRLIVHHRLSDFTKMSGNDEKLPVERSLLEVESWDGDVILTTFVQLFQSLFTGNNRSLKKINKLAGSIVILDEAQAIPEEYMPLIGAALQKIAEYYGTRFILMTATQPRLLDFGSMLLKNNPPKTVQMLPNYRNYFISLKRTKFVPLLNKEIDTNDFIKLFFDRWNGKKSALIVVNTIKRSIDIYNNLKDELNKRKLTIPLHYLSTNIIPKKRRKVIYDVKKELDNGKPAILVSTQTIEAGVDLDFDMGFRDFAPLDSLIQTAGRVNREGRKGEYLPVYIVCLGSDNQHIYGLEHRQDTMNFLMRKSEYMENEYFDLTQEYYSMALKRLISDKSKKVWEGILKLDFEEIDKFHLIDKINEVCDVFVEEDDTAGIFADAYEALLLNKDNTKECIEKALGKDAAEQINGECNIFQRKAFLKLISGKMNDYIIQVRIKNLIKNRPFEFKARGGAISDMFWIPRGQIEDYYNNETGFISDDAKAFMF
jgi:CRISPR-associated endonuclease/helicase Cas3